MCNSSTNGNFLGTPVEEVVEHPFVLKNCERQKREMKQRGTG